MKSYLTNSKIFGLWPLWRPQGQKRPKKQVWLKMLRIVQFGEKSNKKIFPSQNFFDLCNLGESRSLTLVAFFQEKSGFWGSRKLVFKNCWLRVFDFLQGADFGHARKSKQNGPQKNFTAAHSILEGSNLAQKSVSSLWYKKVFYSYIYWQLGAKNLNIAIGQFHPGNFTLKNRQFYPR